MASDIQSLTVQVPQLIQSVAVRAPQPVQSVVVSTGLRGITGEGEDSTARSAAAAAQLSADFGYSTAPSWGLKLRVHPGDASLFDVTAGAYVSLDRDGSVIQSTQAPSLSDYSRYAYLGIVVVVPDTHTVALVFNLQNYGGDVGLRLQQFLQSVGVFNIDGNVYSQANASTTKIRRSAGHIFRPGCNSDIDPRIIDVSTTNATDPYESFHPVSHQGGLWYYPPANSSDIDGNNYDSGTDLLPMPSGYFQIQSIFTFGTASTFIQYGQVLYTTRAEAEAHVGDDF